MVDDPWGQAISADKLGTVLEQHPDAAIVAMVQAETSTGAASDVATLCAIAREHDCLTLVDSVTAIGGIPVQVDEWGIDALYSGSQKCLAAPPGLSPVTFGERALETVRRRKTKVKSWFFDLNLLIGYWLDASLRE